MVILLYGACLPYTYLQVFAFDEIALLSW